MFDGILTCIFWLTSHEHAFLSCQLPVFQANLQARSPGMLPSAASRQQPQAAVMYQQPPYQAPRPQYQAPQPQPQPQPQPRTSGTSALSAMGINTDMPKHPEYAAEASRMLTFRIWTTDRHQPADVLCRAGFFYTGIDCFTSFSFALVHAYNEFGYDKHLVKRNTQVCIKIINNNVKIFGCNEQFSSHHFTHCRY